MKTAMIASFAAILLPALAGCQPAKTGGEEADTGSIPKIEGYTLLWSDEFNGTDLNTKVWNIEVNGNGGGNNELQYYTDRKSNVSMGTDPESGEKCLILTAIKESYSGRSCTSGRVNTKNKMAFKHGLVEARMKIPRTTNGLWPAFWMMGNDYDRVGWPACGEIDIMEMGSAEGIKNNTQERYFSGWMHWGPSYNGGAYPNYGQYRTNSYAIQGSYHTFRLYWDENQIRMYLDQNLYPTVEPYCTMDIPASDADAAPGKYFHKPFFILFNLAVGGNFTGTGNINDITALNAENGYKANFYIDYVRVYQKE